MSRDLEIEESLRLVRLQKSFSNFNEICYVVDVFKKRDREAVAAGSLELKERGINCFDGR